MLNTAKTDNVKNRQSYRCRNAYDSNTYAMQQNCRILNVFIILANIDDCLLQFVRFLLILIFQYLVNQILILYD